MTRTANNLTREKIHQLLAAIGSKAADQTRQIEATEYDWRQPHYFSNNQIKKLETFTARMAAAIAKKFAALCQGQFEVAADSASQHYASHFLDTSPDKKPEATGNYYLAFKDTQERPCGFISIPPDTAAAWTTQLLGETEVKDDDQRTLTKLEESLLLDVAFLIVETLHQADKRCEVSPAASALTDRLPLELKGTEEFCKISFKVKKTGTEQSCQAHVLIFCEQLAPVVGQAACSAKQASAGEISESMLDHIHQMPVSVTARLASVPLTLEQIIGLAADDILLLDKKATEPIELLIDGRPLFRGKAAKSDGNYAVIVEKTVFDPIRDAGPNTSP